MLQSPRLSLTASVRAVSFRGYFTSVQGKHSLDRQSLLRWFSCLIPYGIHHVSYSSPTNEKKGWFQESEIPYQVIQVLIGNFIYRIGLKPLFSNLVTYPKTCIPVLLDAKLGIILLPSKFIALIFIK